MVGIQYLNNLPQPVKDKIVEKFGSIKQLYSLLYSLVDWEYRHTVKQATLQLPTLKQINEAQFNIESELDKILQEVQPNTMQDGRDIFTEVSNDFGELVVAKQISELNERLAQYGTDFERMKAQLSKYYGQ